MCQIGNEQRGIVGFTGPWREINIRHEFSFGLSCQKLGLADLPGHNRKLTSDMNLDLSFYERSSWVNRNNWSYLLVIFQKASQFAIDFVRLTLPKVGVDGFYDPHGKLTSDKKIILTSYYRH